MLGLFSSALGFVLIVQRFFRLGGTVVHLNASVCSSI